MTAPRKDVRNPDNDQAKKIARATMMNKTYTFL
jgi:hypothetical protein